MQNQEHLLLKTFMLLARKLLHENIVFSNTCKNVRLQLAKPRASHVRLYCLHGNLCHPCKMCHSCVVLHFEKHRSSFLFNSALKVLMACSTIFNTGEYGGRGLTTWFWQISAPPEDTRVWAGALSKMNVVSAAHVLQLTWRISLPSFHFREYRGATGLVC